MVVTMPAEASHASRRRRRAGGAGSGGMARPLAETVRRALPCTPPPARNNQRESRERAMQQTNRYSRCGDSAASARAKCGHRVLPPFVRFSAVFVGRAHAQRSLQPVDDPRPRRRCLLHPAPAPSDPPHPCTRSDAALTIPLFAGLM